MKILLSFFFILTFSFHSNSQTKLSVGDSIQKKINLGDTHVYNIRAKKGGFYKLMFMQKGIDLVIEVESTGSKPMTFDSPNGRNGPEVVEFSAEENGNATLKVTPYPDTTNAKSGDYTISYVEKLSPSEYSVLLKKQEEEKALLVEWIKQNSIPLKSVNAGSGQDDLDKLKPVLTNKRVIALGEASHGTKEFFQMKHRMLEYLVQELGFTVFAIEASYGRCKYINNYILTGEGDLDTAVAIQGFTTWDTEEVKDMISWMRDYNIDNPDNLVRFVGFDLQVNDAVAFDISKYYLKVDPGSKPDVDSLLKNVLEAEKKGGIFSGDSAILTLITPFEELISDYSTKEEEYILKSARQEYDEILWSEKVLLQYLISFSNSLTEPGFKNSRDFYMAQNILEWLKYFPDGTKMVVWAHNGHVAKDYVDAVSFPSMGSYLKEALGNDYYAIGFDFYEGKFQSNNIDLENSPGWEEMEVGPAPEGNLSAFFVKAGLGNSILDISGSDQSAIIKEWLNERVISTYSMGSQFSANWPPSSYIVPTKLRNAFDCVIFIRESSRAVPLKRINIERYEF